jgi:hypothetical protein
MKKTDTAKYMYKCRLCGAQFFDGSESGVERANRTMRDIALFGKDCCDNVELYGDKAVHGMKVDLVMVHQCHGTFGMKAEGLADLIGYMVDNK